ncbi:MAG: glycosyltransferase family 2 protein [Selenomonadaceae bacterium]|nr:glycosyltransferase family 2 protein [Selenomonadaceae bacterium]MBR1859542.1 glycosyltransferase family 2 protein [Selenomonadaceae bacterium]
MKTISILVPCYNEEVVLLKFYERVQSVIKDIADCEFNFVFVNDGSTDSTVDIMRHLRKNNANVHYVNLSRNFGKEIAMIAGLDHVDSDAVIIMDADLQDPPELLPEMISWWNKGYKDVCAKRRSRDGESWFKKWSSHTYYKLLQHMTNIPIQIDVGDFRLLDRQCIEALKLFRESQRYTKGMFSWIGFDKKEILFDRDARAAGKTKWNYWKLFNLAIEGITSFTMLPLRIASILGCILSITTMIYMIYVILRTLIFGEAVRGYPSMVSIILFIGGVQIFFLGIIGEYLGRIFNETKHRPLYLVKEYDGEIVIKQKV